MHVYSPRSASQSTLVWEYKATVDGRHRSILSQRAVSFRQAFSGARSASLARPPFLGGAGAPGTADTQHTANSSYGSLKIFFLHSSDFHKSEGGVKGRS